MSQILYCLNCKKYTLNKVCDKCNHKTVIKKPARYSPQDRHGEYRRKLKKLDRKD